jgi:alkanesulfonate monooxygenase SsuD/methylene tetrahydromethanopterin reductase-like flavin-dependent oxidoreductase (luciferase family)
MVEVGIQIEPQFGFTYDKIRELALLCESAGFNSIWCSDHFFMSENSEEQDCLDCWTILAGLARETSTLRLGSLVTAVSYRYPAVLAKIAASVDNMALPAFW